MLHRASFPAEAGIHYFPRTRDRFMGAGFRRDALFGEKDADPARIGRPGEVVKFQLGVPNPILPDMLPDITSRRQRAWRGAGLLPK